MIKTKVKVTLEIVMNFYSFFFYLKSELLYNLFSLMYTYLYNVFIFFFFFFFFFFFIY